MMTSSGEAPSDRVGRLASKVGDYVSRYDAAHDPRAVFAYTYWRLTTSLGTSLAAGDPAFMNPSWVADLAEALASEYFTAMNGIDDWVKTTGGPAARAREPDLPDEIPQPWREVYVAMNGERSYVLEDVLFAMMAHISYDLPVALRRMAHQGDVRSHIADFHAVNSVLGSAVDSIQQEIASRYSRGLASLDRLFARQDELLSNYGIRLSRGVAWYNFERLQDPDAAPGAMGSIERSTGSFIQQVRAPDDWRLRLALRVARWIIPERRQWPSQPPLVGGNSQASP